VAEIRQTPNASFSYKGVLFNEDEIEIQILHNVSSSYLMYRHLKTQELIFLLVKNCNGSNNNSTQQVRSMAVNIVL
jgi:hypothetical protein